MARNQPRVAVEFPSKEANIGHRARSNLYRPKPPAILTDAANIGDAVLKPGRGLNQTCAAGTMARKGSNSQQWHGRANSQHPKRAIPAARSIPMRSILATVAGLLLCSLSFAQGIPSAASGVYLTPDRVCRVVLARYQVSWLRADLTCLEFNGALSNAATVLYAPGEGSCWPSGAAIPFNPQSPVDYVTFSSFTGAVLNALVGNQAAVINGGGVEQIWQRIAIVPSPSPYTCSGGSPPPDPHYARLCRQYGLYCGG